MSYNVQEWSIKIYLKEVVMLGFQRPFDRTQDLIMNFFYFFVFKI